MTYQQLPSDAAFEVFLKSLEPEAVALDRAAHMTPVELRILWHTNGHAA